MDEIVCERVVVIDEQEHDLFYETRIIFDRTI